MKSVVVTGASAGIGAAIARKLAAAGHRVLLSGRRERELSEEAHLIGSRASFFVADVTRRKHVDLLRDEAIRLFETVDVWINNAGRGISCPVMKLSDADFDSMMSVNVKSALYGMQAIVPHFLERGEGHLINISSFLARVPLASHRSAYNAAKAALNALTANLRMDLASTPGIHVSVVMPGLVSTDFARNVLGEPASAPPPWVSNTAALPAGAMKPQTADEVADVIVELIEHPRGEVYTNPVSASVAQSYYDDVDAFEKRLFGR